MKDKNTAGLLAVFLGGVGAHKFYTGRTGMGILYLVFCWTLIPAFVSVIEAILFFTMTPEVFSHKFNTVMAMPAHQNIVVNVQNAPALHMGSSADRLKALHDLKTVGALTEEEFTVEKRKLLSAS